MEPKNRIIVALDGMTLGEALTLVQDLNGEVGMFKIGLELMTAHGGYQCVLNLKARNCGVFYDGKFCDIPATVGKATAAAAAMGVDMLNVHASCGIEAMRAAVANKGNSKVLAVTVLTSIDDAECRSIFGKGVPNAVHAFADEAQRAGVDGLVCSPQDLSSLSHDRFKSLLKVTPGVRPAWAAAGDQKRVMTPREAVEAGSDYLVIGRPITKPPKEIGSPLEAVRRIVAEIAA